MKHHPSVGLPTLCLLVMLAAISLHESDTQMTTSNTVSPRKVRLVGGSSEREGRVEVYYQGAWGTVCDNLWNINDADVVCRMLDLDEALSASCCAAFGQGTGNIHLDEVSCTETETDITDCAHDGYGINDCSHSQDAGVICSQMICYCTPHEEYCQQRGEDVIDQQDISSTNESLHISGYSSLPNMTRFPLLMRLTLDNCNISTIDTRAFWGLWRLLILTFANCNIFTIDSNAFRGLIGLQELDLSSNQISVIQPYAFAGLSVISVNLSSNQISTLESAAFAGLTSFRFLKMSDHGISYKCATCGREYNAVKSLRRHIRDRHMYTCHHCSFEATTQAVVDKHEGEKHTDKGKRSPKLKIKSAVVRLGPPPRKLIALDLVSSDSEAEPARSKKLVVTKIPERSSPEAPATKSEPCSSTSDQQTENQGTSTKPLSANPKPLSTKKTGPRASPVKSPESRQPADKVTSQGKAPAKKKPTNREANVAPTRKPTRPLHPGAPVKDPRVAPTPDPPVITVMASPSVWSDGEAAPKEEGMFKLPCSFDSYPALYPLEPPPTPASIGTQASDSEFSASEARGVDKATRILFEKTRQAARYADTKASTYQRQYFTHQLDGGVCFKEIYETIVFPDGRVYKCHTEEVTRRSVLE